MSFKRRDVEDVFVVVLLRNVMHSRWHSFTSEFQGSGILLSSLREYGGKQLTRNLLNSLTAASLVYSIQ